MKRIITRRSLRFVPILLLGGSVGVGYRSDDWTRFDHQSFKVIRAESGDSLRVEVSPGRDEVVKLLGIDGTDGTDAGRAWLTDHAAGGSATLLLESPQARDSSGRLRAFVFVDNQNLSVEMVKAGLAYADRREKTLMDGLIDPAESEARKKKRGMWNGLRYDQMPQWRRDWLRSLPPRK